MKKIFFLIAFSMAFTTLLAQSGEGYDPENPGDPNPCYKLHLEASPRTWGEVNTNNTQLMAGQTYYCSAEPNPGFVFKRWMMGDSVVSTNKSFYFAMPAENVTLIAYFTYDPSNPGDPFIDGYSHEVNVYANPSSGGYFNKNYFTMREGETTEIYAYPYSNFRFVSWKQNGSIISTSNPLEITMGDTDLSYTAQFVYDPQNPGNPMANYFNPSTGELIMDDFEPGNLNYAINKVLSNYNYSDVQSIVIEGEMDTYDFGFSYYMYNCSSIDLARTTGYTQIPSYAFEDMSSLTKVVLPSSVERIGSYAFSGCSWLSELLCYATVPPVVNNNAFDESIGALTVRVPSSALTLYTQAEVWKNFFILPLDQEICKLTVNLPADAEDGRYKNMTIDVKNVSNGQTVRYIITDNTSYTFNNLVGNSVYNVIIKNTSGAMLGAIYDILLTEEEQSVTFESLLQPQDITLSIYDADNNDVTSQVKISWYDVDGKYITQGSTLKGIIENTKLKYSIDLSKELAMQYVIPNDVGYTVKPSDNNIVVDLVPFEEITISGFVKDNTSGAPINYATASITQTLNDKYSKSTVVTTDNTGKFTANIYKTACKVTISANDYLSNTITVDDIENTEALNNILLKEITGVKINTLFTYTNSVVDGETAETQNYYSDYANISYSVYHKTTQHEVENINVQYPYIVLMGNIKPGDEVSVTASSRNNMFMDVTVDCVVDEDNLATVTFPIVELGKIQSSYSYSETPNVVGILYDSDGQFLRKSNYTSNNVLFNNLTDGSYSLVTMKNSDMFNTILNLSEMNAIGLREGAHYIKNDVTVESGKISLVSINEIYDFDESEFYYTGDETSFTVNKQSVTVSNYVTLRAKVDFKSEFANNISDVKLIFDLPSSCEFVNNSVMVGNSIGGYTLGENRVEVELANINDLVRFCITPIEGGKCNPTALVSFKLNGEDVLQPIGSAGFEAKNMEINVPEITSNTSVSVRGYAPANSDIMIYDNDIMVASVKTMPNGVWQTKIELHKPYSYSYHSIYAEIIMSSGQKFLTDTKDLLYDESYVGLQRVRMLYNGKEILFNVNEGIVEPNGYTYVGQMGISEYTFIAEFAEEDPSSLSNVRFAVLLTNGMTKHVDAIYDANKKYWIANADFPDDTKVPINVRVEYYCPSESNIYDEEKAYDDSIIYNAQLQNVRDLYDNGTAIINSENEDVIQFSIIPENEEDEEFFEILEIDYLSAYNNLKYPYNHLVNDSMDCYYKDTLTDCSYTILILDNINEEAFTYTYYGVNINNADRAIPVVAAFTVGGLTSIALERFIEQSNVRQWESMYDNSYRSLHRFLDETHELIFAKCENGEDKIESVGAMIYCIEMYWNVSNDVDAFLSEFRTLVDLLEREYHNAFLRRGVISCAISGASGAISNVIKKSFSAGFHNTLTSVADDSGMISDCTMEIMGQIWGGVINDIIDYINPDASAYERLSIYYNEQEQEIMSEILNLIKTIKGYYSCEDEPEEPEEPEDYGFPTPPLETVIDPSGFVYEGVSSNRVEGVMASCYYKEFVEDMYGDIIENVVLWDAEAYAQENPLFTDENGMYRWDVPQGLWQVKFEKEGYETTYSEWLPVPPPQLEVNIPIVQYSQPNVIFARAYQNAIEVHFDKYMMPNFLTTDNITVTVDGENVAGSIEFLDEEACYEGMNEKYVSKVRFNADEPFQAEEVTLTVESSVRSYANIRMQDDFTQTFTVEVEIQKIVCPPSLQLTYNEETTIEVSVIPAVASKGKTLNIVSQTPLILSVNTSSVVINEEGKAQITLKGELPGSASLSFNVEGYDINAQTSVKVEQKKIYDSNQTMTLNEGWNWVSTYLDIDGNDGLNRIQKALGGNAQQIKSQLAFSSYSDGDWFGLMESASTEEMYMIMMSEEAQMSLNGNLVDPAEHPITLQQNWTWFGYILNEDMSLEDGFANFTPNDGDYVKSQLGFNTYYDGNWYGETALSFEVGKGYMYRNTSGAAKTLVYPSNNSKGRYVGSTSVEKHWDVDVNKYPTNMSIIAVVNVDDEEMTDYEIGAFSDGECRGSARPVYVDALNRYLLFLTVHGEGNDEITFRYYDVVADEEYDYVANEMIYYSADATLGTMPEPYTINFGTTNVNDHTYCSFEVYPNPVDKNNEIHLGTICEKVEVYNSIGVKVAEYSDVNTIDGIEVPGVYIINAIGKNSVKYCRLIVK